MSRPVKIMVAMWPLLYPENMDHWQEEMEDDGQGEGHAAEAARNADEKPWLRRGL